MRITVIPDVHGTHHWEQTKASKDDRIVFMGDYVDSWDNRQPDQMKNLQAIFDFKKSNPDRVTVLMGNHDLAYLSDPWVSGHQWDYATEIWSIINYNIELFDMAAEFDGWLFSHAGITKTWLSIYGINKDTDVPKPYSLPNWNNMSILHRINGIFHADHYKIFDFGPYCTNSYGESPYSPPTWVRPRSLLSDMWTDGGKYKGQVVGHTEIRPNPCFYQKNGNRAIIVDSPEHDSIFHFDTEAQYQWTEM